MSTHAHITAWVLALILFLVALALHKNDNQKGFKILQMILRLLYVLILVTGFMLFFNISEIDLLYIVKAVLGLWVISMFELILLRTGKKQKATVLWIQLTIAFILVLYLGFKLPLGFHIF